MSTETKWTWERIGDVGQVPEFTLNGPDILCRYWHDQPRKDAHLIAAARELYEELETLVGELEAAQSYMRLSSLGFQVMNDCLARSKAVLKKARGES